jgi:cell division protease FtsH
MTFGGRAAEKLVFGKISTGAQSDLDQVTKMAYSMISVFGMNEKVGQVSFYGMQNESFNKPFSDITASMIDEEVRNLVNSQYIRAQEVLTERRDALEKLAQALLEKEVLLKSDVERLIGSRPFADEPTHDVNIQTPPIDVSNTNMNGASDSSIEDAEIVE